MLIAAVLSKSHVLIKPPLLKRGWPRINAAVQNDEHYSPPLWPGSAPRSGQSGATARRSVPAAFLPVFQFRQAQLTQTAVLLIHLSSSVFSYRKTTYSSRLVLIGTSWCLCRV